VYTFRIGLHYRAILPVHDTVLIIHVLEIEDRKQAFQGDDGGAGNEGFYLLLFIRGFPVPSILQSTRLPSVVFVEERYDKERRGPTGNRTSVPQMMVVPNHKQE
jgi:hypothetical protein